jgi:gamma-glutamyltranspeptidase
MIEAKKLAFEDRAKFYADPDFSKSPCRGLLSKAYAAERRALIKPARAGEDLRRRQPRRCRTATRSTSPPPTPTATWSRSSRATTAAWAAA